MTAQSKKKKTNQKRKGTQSFETRQTGSIKLDLAHLESVLLVLAKHKVNEFEWVMGSERLHVKTSASASAGAASQAHHLLSPAAIGGHAAMPSPLVVSQPPAAASAPSVSSEAQNSRAKQVESPFVGTFYRSPSPSADPYVREGQVVKKGDTLCIIEAMKLMNEIEAELSGRIVRILVDNGQPVEFGEPLFLIEPV
jgi:acetyl-CoA carboxylase biotin carboxyl carrier protein